MTIQRSTRVSICLFLTTAGVGIAGWSPIHAVARSARTNSDQLVQQSKLAMRSAFSLHSESRVHIFGPALGGKTSTLITAHVRTDCSGGLAAIRAEVRGTVVVGGRLPQPIDMHYIFLTSRSSTGTSTGTVFWERDVTKGNRWHTVQTVWREPAYTAFFASSACPADGRVYSLAQGMSHTHLAAPARGTSLGRPIWAIAGTSGTSSEHFSFRLLIDRATQRLDGYTQIYVQRTNGRVVARWQIATTYSRYDTSFTITAPHVTRTS